MKKLILISLVFIAAVSCSKSSEPYDELSPYVALYQRISIQNDLALDPFNVAYRLDIYIREKSSNAAGADALKKQLFGNSEITEDNGKYTIKYNAIKSTEYPTNDFARQGSVVVNTHGTKLGDPGSVWSVETTEDKNNPYTYLIPDFATLEMRIDRNNYNIERVEDSKWMIVSDELYLREYSMNLISVWNSQYYVKQTKGTATAASLESAEFSVETLPTFDNGGKDIFGVRIRYNITSPVLYATKCGFMKKGAGDERLIILDDNYKQSDTVSFYFGKVLTCNPPMAVTRRDKSKIYNSLIQ